MTTKKRGGFISIIAIVAIGVVLAGGAAAAFIASNRSGQGGVPQPVPEEGQTSAPQEVNESSSEPTELSASGSPGATVAVSAKQVLKMVVPDLDAETREICESVISESIRNRCLRLARPAEDTPEQREDWQETIAWIKEAWQNQEKVRASYEAIQSELKKAQEDSENGPAEEVPAQEESYAGSATYPIILSFEDNKGNIYKRSEYNKYSGPYSTWPDENQRVLRVGDTIRATAAARDPQSRALEYNWNSSSQVFNDAVGRGTYKAGNTLEYTITHVDLQSAGETFRLVWQVRVVGADHYRFGGGQYDDSGFIDYKIVP